MEKPLYHGSGIHDHTRGVGLSLGGKDRGVPTGIITTEQRDAVYNKAQDGECG